MALSITYEGVDVTSKLRDGTLKITTTSGERPGRCDFTLTERQAATVGAPVVVADGATTYFDGDVRSVQTTEIKPGHAITRYTALDAGAVPAETMAPFGLADVDAETAYVNGVIDPLIITPHIWWRLGEASGTTAVDEMGVQDATYVNAPTLGVAGAMTTGNTAVTLNGTDEYLTAGAAHLRGQSDLTIAAWFKTAGAAADQIIYAERSTLANALIRLYINTSGRPVFQWRDDAATLNTFTVASGDWSDDAWHLVVVTKSTPNVYIVVDGVTVLTGTQTATDTQTSTMTANIGRDPQAGDQWWNGSLDEIMLQRFAFGITEIRALYAYRDTRRYLSMTSETVWDGITDEVYNGTASTLDAGLAAGQIIGVTSANNGFVVVSFPIQEVTLTWLNATTRRYDIVFGSVPVKLAAAFA